MASCFKCGAGKSQPICWRRGVRMPSIRDTSLCKLVTLRQTRAVGPAERVQARRSAPREFRQDIEGLRAVAVLAVVLFHAEVPGVGGGYVGVDVFFVISGFLITGLLWREASTDGTIRLRRF